jgi:hypothetical protein
VSVVKLDMKRARSLDDGRRRLGERAPLAVTVTLFAFAFPDDPRINTDAGVVEKDAPVHFADIDSGDSAGEQRLRRLL